MAGFSCAARIRSRSCAWWRSRVVRVRPGRSSRASTSRSLPASSKSPDTHTHRFLDERIVMTPALFRSLPVLVLFLLLSSSVALGHQAARATLTGTVSDPNGAVVSGATVIATQRTSSIRRETVSNDEGLYVFSDMTPGEYELRVEAKGFNPNVSKVPVSLNVGQSTTVNVSLSVNLNDPGVICVLVITDSPMEIDNIGSSVQGVIDSDRKSTRLNSSH